MDQHRHLSRLAEKAAQATLLAGQIELLLSRTTGSCRERCMQRYRLLLERQEQLLEDMWAQLRGMEDEERGQLGEEGALAEACLSPYGMPQPMCAHGWI